MAIYGIIVYFFVFPSNKKQNSDQTTSVITDADSSKIKLDVQSGNMSSDKKMILTLKISGLDGKDAVEELRKEGNIDIDVDEQKAEIQDTETEGDDALVVRLRTNVADDKYKDFNDGKSQNLDVRANLKYESGAAETKIVSTNFSKGDKNSSLGQEIAFGDKKDEKVEVKPTPNSEGPTRTTKTPKTPPEIVREKPKTTVSNPPLSPPTAIERQTRRENDKSGSEKGKKIGENSPTIPKSIKDGGESDRIKKGKAIND